MCDESINSPVKLISLRPGKTESNPWVLRHESEISQEFVHSKKIILA